MNSDLSMQFDNNQSGFMSAKEHQQLFKQNTTMDQQPRKVRNISVMEQSAGSRFDLGSQFNSSRFHDSGGENNSSYMGSQQQIRRI